LGGAGDKQSLNDEKRETDRSPQCERNGVPWLASLPLCFGPASFHFNSTRRGSCVCNKSSIVRLLLVQFHQPISICTSHSCCTASLRLRCDVGAFTTRRAAFPTENNNNNNHIIGVARGCSGYTCTTPGRWKNCRRNLQIKNWKCTTPAHQVHPRQSKSQFLGLFLLWAGRFGRLFSRFRPSFEGDD